MNHEKMREHVHKGIDRQCESLTSDPYRVQRVLNKAHETQGTGGFVVKKKHSQKASDTSSDYGEKKQDCLGNAECAFPGFVLVERHREKRGQIDEQKIEDNNGRRTFRYLPDKFRNVQKNTSRDVCLL